jgi:hypothetical protein
MMVLISIFRADCHAGEEPGKLVASGHEVMLFQLLDPAEVNFNFDKASCSTISNQSRNSTSIRAARRNYLQRLDAHNSAARSACEKLGITYHRFTSDQPLELALFDFLRSRMQRGSKAKRTGGKLTRPATAA